MNIGKISKKNGTAQFVIKSQKGQQLNEREVYEINTGIVDGLLRCSIERRKSGFKLYYDLTGYMTLRGFLRNPLNKQTFALLLKSIIDNINSLQQAYFNYQYVLLDINRVLVNPSTNKVYFIYVPIQSFDTHTSLKELLTEIIKNATFSNMEDNSYVRDYIRIINSGINFSVFELEEYINSISSGVGKGVNVQKVVCPRCNNIIPKGMTYCLDCGTKILEQRTQKRSAIYDPAGGNSYVSSGFNQESCQDLSYNDVYQSSVEKSPNLPKEQVNPFSDSILKGIYLVRKKNGEKIPINKTRFLLGKDKQHCDYSIIGNTAISRAHAEIISYNNHYFIVDKNSTNKTFVNDSEIPPDANIEIWSGTKIRLADEDFVFFTS